MELPAQKISSKEIKNTKPKIKKVLGMTISDLNDKEKNSVGKDGIYGIKVIDIIGNPAYEAGLLKNDIIYQISGNDIKSTQHFEKLIKKMKKGDFAPLLVRRSQGNSIYLAIKIE